LKSVPWLRGSKIEGRRGSCWGSVPHLLWVPRWSPSRKPSVLRQWLMHCCCSVTEV
jgi:hypothetical protein